MSEGAAVVDDKKGGKTGYCSICNKRHRLSNWPHEGEQGRDLADAATITGAHNAEELGEQTRSAVARVTRRTEKKDEKERQLSPEERERRRAASLKLGRKATTLSFSAVAFVTVNPLWRTELTEADINEIGNDFADFAAAWGVESTGKVISAVVLACSVAEVGGRVAARVKADDLNKAFRGDEPSDTAKNA